MNKMKAELWSPPAGGRAGVSSPGPPCGRAAAVSQSLPSHEGEARPESHRDPRLSEPEHHTPRLVLRRHRSPRPGPPHPLPL